MRIIDWFLYAIGGFILILLYLSVPTYCVFTAQCGWSKYLLPALGVIIILMILNRPSTLFIINYHLILFYSMLVVLAFTSYVLLIDDYALAQFKNYTGASLLLILSSIYFRYITFQKNNSTILFIIIVLASNLFNIIDIFFEGQFFQKVEGFEVRAAGFYVNSNVSAIAILTAMAIVINKIQPNFRLWLLALCLLGVFVTFSRGGLAIWMVLYIYLTYKKIISQRSAVTMAFFLFLGFTSASLIIDFISNYSSLLGSMSNRLDFFRGDSNIQYIEEDPRYNLASYAFTIFTESPVFGNGGNSLLRRGSDQLSHNQYLAFLSDYGIIGIVLFTVFLLNFYYKKPEYTGVLFLIIVSSFFSHNIFDTYSTIIAFSYIFNSGNIFRNVSNSEYVRSH